MSDWSSPMLVVLKRRKQIENSSDQNTAASTNKNKFNLRLFIDYRKLNSHNVTAKQTKADGSLGNIISNYPFQQ